MAVAVEDFTFMPARVEVDKGSTVVWQNRDSAPHTATAAGAQPFDTGVVKKGQTSKPIRFERPGEFPYICDLHPFMKGTVVVR